MLNHWPVREKLLAFILPALVAGLALIAAATYVAVRGVIQDQLTVNMMKITAAMADNFNIWLESRLLEVEEMAMTPDARRVNSDPEEVRMLNYNRTVFLTAAYPGEYGNIFAADARGIGNGFAAENGSIQRVDNIFVGNFAYYQDIMSGRKGAHIAEPVRAKAPGCLDTALVAPIPDSAGTPQGVLGARVTLNTMERKMRELRYGAAGFAVLLDAKGQIILNPDGGPVVTEEVAAVKQQGFGMLLLPVLNGDGVYRFERNGRQWRAFYHPVPSAGWMVVNFVSEADLFAPATQLLRTVLLTVLAVLLFCGVWIIYIARLVSRPLRLLERAADRIAQGNLAVDTLDVSARDEVGRLARAFAAMVTHLRRFVAEQTEIRQEAERAGVVQRSLLPGDYEDDRIQIRTVYQPHHFVSGDFFGYGWNRGKTRFSGFLLDVTGHGMATALQAAALNELFRQAMEHEMSWTERLYWMNREAARYFTDSSFAAVICFELDIEQRTLTYASGGISQFLADSRAVRGVVKAPGSLLGVDKEPEFIQHGIPVACGDSFYFVSDGISDGWNEAAGWPYGDFAAAMQRMISFAGDGGRRDDISAVCIHIKH